MIDGLLEKALRVVPPGAPVVLVVRPPEAAAAAAVEVPHGGPGFTDEDLAVAFEGGLRQRYQGVRKVGSVFLASPWPRAWSVGSVAGSRRVTLRRGCPLHRLAAHGAVPRARRSAPSAAVGAGARALTKTGHPPDRLLLTGEKIMTTSRKGRRMRRFGAVVTAALLSAVGAIGLTGCGIARDPAESAVDVVAGMGAEGQALAALGIDPRAIEPVAAAGPAPASAAPGRGAKGDQSDGWRKRHQARVLLRKNMLHGEAVVQTKMGTKTIVVQRGTVTAIDGDSMTVKSTDGFTMSWTFGDTLRVIERRTTLQPDEVKVGAQVGVAGAKDGDNGVARLIVIPRQR